PPVSDKVYKILRFILKIYWKLKRNTGYKVYPPFFKKQSLKLIKWYYQETYALAEKYKNDFPYINYIEVQLEELNTLAGFEKIIKSFNLNSSYDRNKILDIIGKPVNLKI